MKHILLLSCISIVLHLLNQTFPVHAECNACNSLTNRACVSPTEYKECNEKDEPFGFTYSCNQGYFCSILGDCKKSEEFSDCKLCNKCDSNKVFACLTTKKFALCLGGDNATEITGECNGNYVCNINDPNICGIDTATCSTNTDPSTSTTIAPTTTTESPSQNPNAFCESIKKAGRYPAGSNPQTTCRQYISCIQVGNEWYGPIYNCPNQTFFDPSKKTCGTAQPSTCAGTVGRLAYRNILLE